jgi:hypothetical protein
MSLFAHLAVRFGSHPENLATDALGYVLNASGSARIGMLAAIGSEARGSLPADLVFTTQASTDEEGRPDLAGRDGAGLLRLLVEAKFWAGFTDHQPLSYLKQLPVGGVLLVVGPRVRLPYMERELFRRISDAKCVIERREPSTEQSHAVVDGRHLVVASWQRVLNTMRVELANEPAVLADLVQLLGLCERMDSEAFIPVTAEELTTNVYRRVHEFGTIVDEVHAQLSSGTDRVIEAKGLRSTAANGMYGRYARLRGVPVLLHVSTHKWTKLAPNPIWLTVFGREWEKSDPEPARKALAALETEVPGSLHQDYRGFPTVLLRVSAGAERHEVISDLVMQVRRVGETIASLGFAAGAETVPSDGGES